MEEVREEGSRHSDQGDEDNTPLEIRVSNDHKLLRQTKKIIKKFKGMSESDIQSHRALRLLLFRYMSTALRELEKHLHGTVCLEDFEKFFYIQKFNASSNNAEAYFAHLKTGELRKIKCVIRQLHYNALDFQITSQINSLVLRKGIPHLPLVYGLTVCPKDRCSFQDSEKQADMNASGCVVMMMEYFNGGTLNQWIRKHQSPSNKREQQQSTSMLVTLVTQILIALFGIHKNLGVSHGDAHDSNVVLNISHDWRRQYQRSRGKKASSASEKSSHQHNSHRSGGTTERRGRNDDEEDNTEGEDENLYFHYQLDCQPATAETSSHLDIWLPFKGVQAYLIDYDFLGSDSYHSVEGKVSFKYDYYRILEAVCEEFQTLPSTDLRLFNPAVTRYLETELRPVNQAFVDPVAAARHARFKYTPLEWDLSFLRQFLRLTCPECLEMPVGKGSRVVSTVHL